MMTFKYIFLLAASLASPALSTTDSTADFNLSSLIPPQNGTNVTFPSISTATNANTVAACTKILALHGFETQSLPLAALDPDYDYAKSHYWSAANADLTPQCITFPTSAEDVSNIVSIINEYDDVTFAVKSGGHNPNVGWSSTDGGVLIAMSSLANTTLSNDRTVAHVGPGSRWSAVMEALAPYDLATVGGRLGDVGVGGYLLGGGLSFLSAEYGFACDTVVNYEVVLANASIVNATKDENPDLFWALKGGGNQFGIVTGFDLQTFPIDKVWGGTRVYSGDQASALINATQEFTQNFHDNKAAVIVTGEIAILNLVEIFVVFFSYDGPVVPDGVFDMYDAIPALEDNTSVQSYSDLLNSNDQYNLYGMRYLIRGTTLPVLPSPDGNDLFNYHYQTWKEYVMTEGLPHPDYIFSLAFQPLPTAIAKASLAAGGDAIALDPNTGDHMWMEYDVSWESQEGDDDAHSIAMNISASIDAYAKQKYRGVKSVGYVESSDEDAAGANLEAEQYNPIFLNDAMYDQQPLQRYGNGSYEKLVVINQKYDPEGFFRTRTGGFKFD